MFWKPKEEGEGWTSTAAFHRDLDGGSEIDDDQVANWNKTIQIFDTDYHSYLAGFLCEERVNEDSGATEHTEDYFVMTREKQPSMYMRKRARDALLKEGLTEERIKFMHKTKSFECWGKDHHY